MVCEHRDKVTAGLFAIGLKDMSLGQAYANTLTSIKKDREI